MDWRRIPPFAPVFAAALLATGCDRAPAAEQPVALTPTNLAIDRIDAAGAQGRFIADRDGRKTSIAFPLPAARIAPEVAHFGTRLGETDAGAVVMLDQYASRPTGGRCVEGTETFVRVFSLPEKRQTAVLPVESCLGNVKAERAGAEWLDGDRFRILGFPPRTYRVTGWGTISAEGDR